MRGANPIKRVRAWVTPGLWLLFDVCVCVLAQSHAQLILATIPHLKNNLTPRSARLSEYLRNPSIAGFKRYFYPALCVTR